MLHKGQQGKYLSIGEAAAAVHATSETLRHYDRIGLVSPSYRDEWTSYRYYTDEDIVRLNTVRALQLMDLSLDEIKKALEYGNLDEIIDFLRMAEKKADEKIAALKRSKEKIKKAKADYEHKKQWKQSSQEIILRKLPERVIMLSDTLTAPTLDNLWNYLGHFYEKIPEEARSRFSFEDLAGIYTEKDFTRLFAVCVQYADADGIKHLPAGNYLTKGCSEENREETIQNLLCIAREEYRTEPPFYAQLIIISGILQWNYEIQVYIP